MAKTPKTTRSATTAKAVVRPIGRGKAQKFSAVEGLSMNAESRSLVRDLSSRGLKGDAYRAAVVKAFKKG